MKKWLSLLLIILPILLCATDWAQLQIPVSPMMNLRDNNGRAWRTTEILREENVDGSYSQQAKFVYTYNNVNPALPDSIYIRYWDEGSSLWITGAIYTYTLNTAGNRIVSVIRSQNDDQTMIPVDFFNFTFDNQNRLSGYAYNEFDLNDMVLYERSRYYYLYPGNQGLQIVRAEHYPEFETSFYERSDYSFDTQGRNVDINRYTSSDSLSWGEYLRTHLQYHANDTTDYASTLEYIAQMHPYQALTFGLYESPYVYNGILSSYMTEYWNGVSWNLIRNHLYSYNPLNQLLTFQIQMWGEDDWMNYKNHLFTYLTSGNLSQQVEYEWGGSSWYPVWRYTFTWNEYTSAEDNTIPVITGIRLHTSPNPFADELSIRTEGSKSAPAVVSVYNVKGQLIRTLNTNLNSELAWDGRDDKGLATANGVYFLRLFSDGVSSSGKVLKIK